jgi:hypothetical protein
MNATNDTPKAGTGDFVIVDYSEKAIAIFGDNKKGAEIPAPEKNCSYFFRVFSSACRRSIS